MPDQPPPPNFDGDPRSHVLAARTALSRVHSARFDVCAFNPTLADAHWGGGRFDATSDDPYPYLYAAGDDATAVAESLLRDHPADDHGARLLPRKATHERRISWLRPTADLQLVSLLSGQDLAAVAQDTWLIHARADDYGKTRRWGHAIRSWAPWAQGFIWSSRFNPEGVAYILFADRCPPDCLEAITVDTPIPPNDNYLDRGAGALYLAEILQEFRVTLYS
jgi:RES domain